MSSFTSSAVFPDTSVPLITVWGNMYSCNPGFVHIDSNQHNTGRIRIRQLPSSSGFYQKNLFPVYSRSLTVILRMSVTRSVFACPSGFLYPILMYPALLRPAFCQLLLALFESLPASLRRGRLASLRAGTDSVLFFSSSCTFTFLCLPTVSPPDSPHIL